MVVFTKTMGVTLKVLSRARGPMTGREVARLAGVTHTSVARALKHLVEHGLLEARSAGRATLYMLNEHHVAHSPVLRLLDLRRELLRRMQDELESWQSRPLHVSVFGSAARGDGSTKSDIDVFIVRGVVVHAEDSVWRDQVFALDDRIRKWTGNPAGIAEVSERELGELRRSRPAIVNELERDAVTLLGPSVRELLRASAK